MPGYFRVVRFADSIPPANEGLRTRFLLMRAQLIPSNSDRYFCLVAFMLNSPQQWNTSHLPDENRGFAFGRSRPAHDTAVDD